MSKVHDQKISKDKEVRHLSPADARIGQELSKDGVAIQIVETIEHKNEFGPSTYIVCYRIKDFRQSPPFISPPSHIFPSKTDNLIDEAGKIRDVYEQQKAMLREAIRPGR